MLKNIGSNWVLTLANIPVVFLLTPFIIHSLGREGYGVWALINSITGYMSLMAIGVPMASVRYLAEHVAEGDSRKVNEAVSSCAGLYLILGGVAVLVGAGMLLFFAAAYQIPVALQAEARLALSLMVLQAAAGFIGLLPEGIMFAHHDFVLRNLVRLGGILLRLGLTITLLKLDASLVVMASIQLALLAFDFSVSWLLIRRRYPEVRLGLRAFDLAMVRRILSFSVYVLLLNAGARLSFETDALVIGAFLTVESIAFFAVANSFVIYLMDFIVAIAAVVSPMATKLKTEGNLPRLREVFLTWSKVALSVTIGAVLFLVVFGPRLIGSWIGPSFEAPSGQVLRILMLSNIVFLPVRGVALPILMGLGKPRVPAFGLVAAGVLNLALSVALARPLGLAGVALGTAIPNVIFALFVVAVACRELQIDLRSYAGYVIPRAALGALPLLGVLLWFKLGLQVQSLPGLVAAGMVMAVLFGVTWVFFVYRADPYVDLRPHLVRLRAWTRA